MNKTTNKLLPTKQPLEVSDRIAGRLRVAKLLGNLLYQMWKERQTKRDKANNKERKET